MKTNKILVVVDYQKDFASPNGALYVPEAETISQTIQTEINKTEYKKIIYTMDTHIKEEYKKSQEATMFPDHCEFNTEGWAMHEITPRNKKIIELAKVGSFETPMDFTIGKESVFVKDKFSIWEGNPNYKEFINQFCRIKTEFVIVGVATNYCVFQNAMGYKEMGFENVRVMTSATKGIIDETYEENIKIMKNSNIKFV